MTPAPRTLLLLALGVTAVAVCEWRTDEETFTLMVMLGFSFLTGAVRPGAFLACGAALGATVGMVNVFASVSGASPVYERFRHVHHSLGWVLSLFILVVPAILAAGLGAAFGKSLRHGGAPEPGAGARESGLRQDS